MQNLIFSCVESRVEDDQTIYGCYKIGPFSLDKCETIAATLRRVLLSNLSGLAIVSVQIEGILHEYSILKGVQESVVDILLNLKQIQFNSLRSIYKPQIAYLNAKGPKIVTSKDLKLPYFIQLAKSNQYIATLSSNGKLNMKIYICEGRRYILQNSLQHIVEKNFKKILKTSATKILVLDAVFFPISKVNYTIQTNQFLNKEFLILEIWTKNSLHPKKAIYKAINEILKIFLPFRKFYSPKKELMSTSTKKGLSKSKNLEEKQKLKFNEKRRKILKNKILSLDLGNLDVSAQTYCLFKKFNLHKISDLIEKPGQKFFSVLTHQPKILHEIETSLEKFGLYLKY